MCCKQMGWALAAARMCGHVLACLYELPVCVRVYLLGEEAEEEATQRADRPSLAQSWGEERLM